MNLIRRSSLLLCLLCVGWPEPVAAAPSAEEQELGAKLDRIDELRDRETGPGLLMAGISSALTPDLWLTELRQDGPQQFVLEGFAFSDEAVTGLVTRLEEADRFTNAELVVLGRGTFAKQELTRFIITFTHLLTPRGGGERRRDLLHQHVPGLRRLATGPEGPHRGPEGAPRLRQPGAPRPRSSRCRKRNAGRCRRSGIRLSAATR